MTKRMTINEDPSISHVAKMEAVRLWNEIEQRQMYEKEPFYLARDKVLAGNIRNIAKMYGNETARRVEQAIMTRDSYSPAVIENMQERLKVYCTRGWGRLRKRDRICIWLFCDFWSMPKRKEGDPIYFI